MQVFKAFLKVMLKNINVACIYISVFLGIAIPMSLSADSQNTFKATKMDVCIFDEDNTPESQALIDYIGNRHDLTELENDEDVIIDALYYESVDYVLTIKAGYAESLKGDGAEHLLESRKMHDSYSTVYMGQQLSEYVGAVKTFYLSTGDTMEAIEKTEEALASQVEVRMPEKSKGNAEFPVSFAAYFQYMPYILLCIFMSVLLTVLRALNDPEIRRRTNCSPLSTGSYTVQIFLGCMVFVLAVWVLLMVVGIFMHHGMYTGNALLAVLNSFIFTVEAALLAILVSAFSPDVMLQNLLTQVFSLGMSFLCGIFIPQYMLSKGVLTAGKLLPAYWYVKANNMLSGSDTYDASRLRLCLLVQVGFAAAFGIAAYLVTRYRREKGK